MDAKEVLEKFVEIEFPNAKNKFTEKNMEFLKRFKINSENEKPILMDFLGADFQTVNIYYEENEHVKAAKERLQALRTIFNRLYRNKKDREDPPFNGDFTKFLEWWCNNVDEKGVPHCYYCHIDETTSKKAFNLELLTTKKPAWKYGSIQIDKKDPSKWYDTENCVFACVLCNNAKSDLISHDDFRELFGPTVRKYWNQIKCEIEKKK